MLVAVHAEDRIRFQRLLKRGREGDAKIFEEFVEHEKKENSNEVAGQQLDKCIEIADTVINSNGTIKEANRDIDIYLASLKGK